MVRVREAVLGVLETIVGFQQAMAQETEGFELDQKTLEEGVRGVFLHPTRGEYFLAEIDDEPVGGLLTVREWSDWRNGEVVWIHSLYVVPEARRQGVFKQLYLHLKHLVDTDEGLKGLRLYVHHSNDIACSAYGALGMDGERYRMFEWMPEDK